MGRELKNSITLKISGNKITSDKFSNGIDSFYKLVDEVAFSVFGKRHPIKWIVDVEKGSLKVKNKPELDDDLDIEKSPIFFNSFPDGIQVLEKEKKYPKYFNDNALGFLKDLILIQNKQNGVDKINIVVDEKEITLVPSLVSNIDALLNIYPKAMSSITGKLLTVSGKYGFKVTIYDDRTQNAVDCTLEKEFEDMALKLFEKRVYAYGFVDYDSRGHIKDMKIKKLEKFGDG